MIVTVLGANGMVGYYIATYLAECGHEVLAVNGHDIDINNPKSVSENVTSATDYVINCIGSVPHRNAPLQEQIKVNSVWPHLLWAWMQKNFPGKRLIHLSTDCVFHADNNEKGFYEGDRTCPNSPYGATKAAGEPAGCMTIRTSIIGEEKKNFHGLIEWVKSAKKIVPGWEDHLWNGVTCLELAKVIEEVVKKGAGWEGVRHIHTSGAGQITKCKLVAMIACRWNRDLKVLLTNSGKRTNRTLGTLHSWPMTWKTLDLQLDELFEWGKNRFNRKL
jgi:dTDP-4-dehydrorhamnose reductase